MPGRANRNAFKLSERYAGESQGSRAAPSADEPSAPDADARGVLDVGYRLSRVAAGVSLGQPYPADDKVGPGVTAEERFSLSVSYV